MANYYKENKERISELRRLRRLSGSSVIESEKKRAADESYRKKKALYLKEYRARIKKDVKRFELEKQKRRERYLKKINANPELKEIINEKARQRHRERMASDPEYRERRKQYYKEAMRQIKAANAGEKVRESET